VLLIGTKISDLSDSGHPNGHRYALFRTTRQLSKPTASDSLKPNPYVHDKDVAKEG